MTQVRILTRLDRLKLIDLYPKNRVRLLVSRRIVWRPDGPIRRQYEKQVKAQFVDYRFRGNDEWLSLETSELFRRPTGITMLHKISRRNHVNA